MLDRDKQYPRGTLATNADIAGIYGQQAGTTPVFDRWSNFLSSYAVPKGEKVDSKSREPLFQSLGRSDVARNLILGIRGDVRNTKGANFDVYNDPTGDVVNNADYLHFVKDATLKGRQEAALGAPMLGHSASLSLDPASKNDPNHPDYHRWPENASKTPTKAFLAAAKKRTAAGMESSGVRSTLYTDAEIRAGAWDAGTARFSRDYNLWGKAALNALGPIGRGTSKAIDMALGANDKVRAARLITDAINDPSSSPELVKHLTAMANPIRLNKGGSVPGAGNRDTVPAMLTPGEYVLRKGVVDNIGVNNLNRLNFNNGGSVPQAKGGASVQIGQRAISAMERLTASIDTGINRAASSLGSELGKFGASVAIFKQAVESIPDTIEMTGRHSVDVDINGLEVLTRLEPTIQGIVGEAIDERLEEYDRNIRAGRNPGSGTTRGNRGILGR